MRATTPGAASQARGGAPSAGDHSAIRRVARQLRKTPVRILAALVVLVVLHLFVVYSFSAGTW
jgi:type VI protein secretion system component VasF